ncbi:hypothetical protein [Mycobacteroides abscessus]|uniref:hypothetical protein n=1 Tax=Mycobacteroides abscessus TaxID=36809 RepID=UPI001E50E287|nr:hypothetical protein [Mycobacteroides abscessus]
MVELTAVAMSCAAVGRSGSDTDGMRGKSVGLICWRCSVGWWACPAEVPDEEALEDLALGAVGVPDGPLPETRLERVGFAACGVATAGAVGVLGVLGDSVLSVVVARGISGSFRGVTSGA